VGADRDGIEPRQQQAFQLPDRVRSGVDADAKLATLSPARTLQSMQRACSMREV